MILYTRDKNVFMEGKDAATITIERSAIAVQVRNIVTTSGQFFVGRTKLDDVLLFKLLATCGIAHDVIDGECLVLGHESYPLMVICPKAELLNYFIDYTSVPRLDY